MTRLSGAEKSASTSIWWSVLFRVSEMLGHAIRLAARAINNRKEKRGMRAIILLQENAGGGEILLCEPDGTVTDRFAVKEMVFIMEGWNSEPLAKEILRRRHYARYN